MFWKKKSIQTKKNNKAFAANLFWSCPPPVAPFFLFFFYPQSFRLSSELRLSCSHNLCLWLDSHTACSSYQHASCEHMNKFGSLCFSLPHSELFCTGTAQKTRAKFRFRYLGQIQIPALLAINKKSKKWPCINECRPALISTFYICLRTRF